jgi:hypothetical protein
VVSPDSVGSLFNVVSLQASCYSRQCAETLPFGESYLGSIAESRHPFNQCGESRKSRESEKYGKSSMGSLSIVVKIKRSLANTVE